MQTYQLLDVVGSGWGATDGQGSRQLRLYDCSVNTYFKAYQHGTRVS